MRELLQFIGKLWRHWVILVTGSGAIALLAVWEHYQGQSIDFRLFAVLAVTAIVWASFRVWREDRQSPPQTVAQEPPSQPSVEPHLEIDWVWVAQAADGSPGAQIVLVASLANRGRPTTADDWTLVVQLEDGRTEQAALRKMPPRLSVEQSGEQHDFSSQTALYDAAMAAPLPTGGKIRGVLWFHVPAFRPEEINRSGCYVVLHARNTFGEILSAAATFAPTGKSLPRVFAGLRE
jgi:hypothetical protein